MLRPLPSGMAVLRRRISHFCDPSYAEWPFCGAGSPIFAAPPMRNCRFGAPIFNFCDPSHAESQSATAAAGAAAPADRHGPPQAMTRTALPGLPFAPDSRMTVGNLPQTKRDLSIIKFFRRNIVSAPFPYSIASIILGGCQPMAIISGNIASIILCGCRLKVMLHRLKNAWVGVHN